eukprot:CAMPEP_0113330602 /NCGR_PEP_ID=MMETSP0010_2-20120614/21766_1 /TAXON_ID=216773 ORGANISM="Corethron hystrix, Strain 308" /NCGR_SAMPLE_ID=MMETSP0010_2 /ASSEMBLY_ACC=CAM_ASM_000155 /LENGTH=91 /DNA_ID=CAMNT_0000193259 /DNA_START=70 /DNA_END=341 /DNA_ORIENTATION=- /assembly_acc=CAM_ASM_000155
MQRFLPDAAIVGGICESGYVTESKALTRETLSRMSVRQLKRKSESLGGGGERGEILEELELVDHVLKLSQHRNKLIHCEDSVFGVVLGGGV